MMNIERKPFGKTARGEAVTLFEIRTPELTARILDYGATVQALLVPDKNGKPVDVVLGHDTIEGYETHDGYLGACVRARCKPAGRRAVYAERQNLYSGEERRQEPPARRSARL